MLLLSVRELSRQFDAEPLFRNVTFDVRSGERIGLVGPNGCGKSTLLRLLVDEDHPDTGVVEKPSSAVITLLEQEARERLQAMLANRDDAGVHTLYDEAKAGLEHLYRLQKESDSLAAAIAGESDAAKRTQLERRYDTVQQDLHRHNAYNIDHRVDEVLYGLGFTDEEFERPLEKFSGGQQTRAMLARTLLHDPDLMLLDEPTNHLDMVATEWLEQYLSSRSGGMILVSHDRYFLDRVTNRILELNNRSLRDFPGNFSTYQKLVAEQNKVLERTRDKQQDFIARTEEFIRRNKYGQKHAQAADREKKLARVELVEVAQEISELPMNFGEADRAGDWVIDVQGIAKGFPDENGRIAPLFENFHLQIERGQRVGILGPNGCGKTTLLRTILSELDSQQGLTPDTGIVRIGTNVQAAYFDQQLSSVDPNLDAIEAVRPENHPEITAAELRNDLARFGIRGDQAKQRVGAMSGGEKCKVALAKLSAIGANFLILDEPTNHLDLWARASLERALKNFAGTLLFVSHDRYFVDQLATHVVCYDKQIENTVERWKVYDGNYSDFITFRANQLAEPDESTLEPKTAKTKGSAKPGDVPTAQPTKQKRQYKYRKVEDLEVEIAEKESLADELEAEMLNPVNHRDGEKIREIKQRYDETREELEHLYAHWEEAMELN